MVYPIQNTTLIAHWPECLINAIYIVLKIICLLIFIAQVYENHTDKLLIRFFVNRLEMKPIPLLLLMRTGKKENWSETDRKDCHKKLIEGGSE